MNGSNRILRALVVGGVFEFNHVALESKTVCGGSESVVAREFLGFVIEVVTRENPTRALVFHGSACKDSVAIAVIIIVRHRRFIFLYFIDCGGLQIVRPE